MTTVFFRYDDYSQISPLALERELVDLFKRHNYKIMFAVIPAVVGTDLEDRVKTENLLDGNKLNFLRDSVTSGVVTLGLHGWNHAANDISMPPCPSEFKGLEPHVQFERISRAYEYLKDKTGIAPEVFVPPWNTYDAGTVTALEKVGIGILSANRHVRSDPSTISYLPATVEVSGLKQAVLSARKSGDDAPVIGVMLHPYDFKESNDSRAVVDLQEFGELLSWLVTQEDVLIDSMSSIAKGGTCDWHRLKANVPSFFENIYPPFLNKVHQIYFYRTEANGNKSRTVNNLIAFVSYLIVLFVSIFLTKAGLNIIDNDMVKIVISFLTASIILGILIRAIYYRAIYFKLMTISVLLSGAFLAAIS